MAAHVTPVADELLKQFLKLAAELTEAATPQVRLPPTIGTFAQHRSMHAAAAWATGAAMASSRSRVALRGCRPRAHLAAPILTSRGPSSR